jgi:hypothetical protein
LLALRSEAIVEGVEVSKEHGVATGVVELS